MRVGAWVALGLAVGCSQPRAADPADASAAPRHDSDAAAPPRADARHVDAFTVDAACGQTRLVLDRPRAPDVMLVVDRSASMNDPLSAGSRLVKWNVVSSALELATSTLGDRLQLGLQLFPAGPTCSTGTHAVEPGGLELGGLRFRLGERPFGPSPLRDALDAARLYLRGRDGGRARVIVLVTDGEPGCGRDPRLDTTTPPACACPGGLEATGPACCVAGHGPSAPVPLCMPCVASDPDVRDGAGAAEAAARIREDGMRLHVVGVAISPGAVAVLDRIAAAGGTERVLAAASTEGVLGALARIGAREASCVFELDEAPPAPERVIVTLDDEVVPSSAAHGFSIDPAARTLTLHGGACDAVRVPARVRLVVTYGCADVH